MKYWKMKRWRDLNFFPELIVNFAVIYCKIW